jgi:hypothetical protein
MTSASRMSAEHKLESTAARALGRITASTGSADPGVVNSTTAAPGIIGSADPSKAFGRIAASTGSAGPGANNSSTEAHGKNTASTRAADPGTANSSANTTGGNASSAGPAADEEMVRGPS